MVKAATPGPIDNEVYAEIQKEFFAEYVDTKHCDNKLDYEQFKLFDDLGPTDPFEIMYFRSLLTDYSIHLINLLNQFCTGINRIKAWDKVYQNDSRDFPTRLYILGTLIYPLLMAWVSAPYVGQQRLGFCTINMLNAWLVVHNNKHPEVKSSDYRLGWLRKAESWMIPFAVSGRLKRAKFDIPSCTVIRPILDTAHPKRWSGVYLEIELALDCLETLNFPFQRS